NAGAAAIQNPNMGDQAAGQWFELSMVILFLLCALAMMGARLPGFRPIRSRFYAFTWAVFVLAATGYLTALMASGASPIEASRDFTFRWLDALALVYMPASPKKLIISSSRPP